MQENRRDDVIEIDLVEVLGLLLHRAWLIILVAIVTAGIGYVVSAYAITPMYKSTTSVYILNKQDNSQQISYSDTQLATQLTKDYKELITCRYVLEKIIENCGLDKSYDGLKSMVAVSNTTDTRIISITVEDADPTQAQFIADSIRDVASEHIKKVMNIEAVNVVDQANLPERPSSPSIMKWTAVGGLLGAFLVIAIVLLMYLVDDTVKTSEDVEKYLGWSTLALIPVMQEGNGKKGKKSKSKKEDEVKESKTSSDEDAIEIIDIK